MSNVYDEVLTVLDGDDTSNSVNIQNYELIGFVVPQTSAATSMTIQVTEANDDVADSAATWFDLYDEAGTQVEITISNSAAIRINIANPALVLRLRRFRVVLDQANTGDLNIIPKLVRVV